VGSIELAKLLGIESKYWLITQWRMAGKLGEVKMGSDGKWDYSQANIEKAKKLVKDRVKIKEGV
jgi:VCBS repeat-containing protein